MCARIECALHDLTYRPEASCAPCFRRECCAGCKVEAAALDQGVNFIDTAAMYGDGKSEKVLAASIRGRRNRLFLATKVHRGIDGRSIRESIDESLSRLQPDHVDLYMIH